ncbi:UBA/THIF-type NAD/FAD binding protein [Magnetococcus marinus MC-1]|uniref:UBA/THIF-type NAD/FAD binding protein n=1 Tax=Magnetococcus marinus (strain ATCC BAA-1437 / JCM 17883 / MC-1) TaxID=156889 RepID=A0L5E1_MAGMM|nr:ThiF family adenylyltransferase [Magnetococcus marinus]ABK43184.1 UBA/THIF-type NAD/FAD binding protein [Magnetococcus marinus MC-1]
MVTECLSWGQQLALEQVADIVAASNGTVELVQIDPPTSEGDTLLLRVSIDTSDYTFQKGGLKFRKREGFHIRVSSRFPIEPPIAKFTHQRFMGQAHVQWGNQICLYLATDVEWSASDGMFGFIKRLDQWLGDAAQDQLDPDDAPLHPPAVYHSSDTKFSVEIDTPELADGASPWIGTAKLRKRNDHCLDVFEWAEIPNSLSRSEKYAAVILLGQSMPMEFPNTVDKLITTFQSCNISFGLLFSVLRLFSLHQNSGDPLYFIIGAPMRRRKAGEPLRQHLTAWKIDIEYVTALHTIVLEKESEAADKAWELINEWACNATTEWCRVYDNRPEVTFRRDQETNASWFLGKSVVLLGCGALGSHFGEYLIRAGVTKLRLIDYSNVHPGILVRQQFKYRQVGYSKNSALSMTLESINPKADIDHKFFDLTQGWPESLSLDEFDLVIDATASRRVAAALQLDWIALIS